MPDEGASPTAAVQSHVNEGTLNDLLAAGTELQELDYKATTDLTDLKCRIDIAKDVACMAANGGYILLGVNNTGVPTGSLSVAQRAHFDEANLRQKLNRWLPDGVSMQTAWFDLPTGEHLALIHVDRIRYGIAVMKADGDYPHPTIPNRTDFAFRKGDLVTRRGTMNISMDQVAIEEVLRREIEAAVAIRREEWRQDVVTRRADAETASTAVGIATGASTALDWQVPLGVFEGAVTELMRRADLAPIRLLLTSTARMAKRAIEEETPELSVEELLDRTAATAGLAATLSNDEAFDIAVAALFAAYTSALDGEGLTRQGLVLPAPVLWRAAIERVEAVGGLLVRLGRFDLVRRLALNSPAVQGTKRYGTWILHGYTEAHNAQAIPQPTGGENLFSEAVLINRAREVVDRIPALRPDADAGDNCVLDSICQFDALACLVSADDHGEKMKRPYWPLFARFYSNRTMPVLNRLADDELVRQQLGIADASRLAAQLRDLQRMSDSLNAMRGFDYYNQPVGEFVAANLKD